MKANFTSYELMNIVKGIFEDEENDFSIKITDSQSTETEVDSIKDYLNINFYTFKKELKDSEILDDIDNQNMWLRSLNATLNTAYGLVDLNGNTPMSSLDFDGGAFNGKVSIIIQSDKVSNLEFYIAYLRNKYIGKLEDLDLNGNMYSVHIEIGDFSYDYEPFTSILGQCVIVSFDINVAYMEQAYSYQDETIEFGFTDDVNGLFYKLAFSKANENLVFTGRGIVAQNRPDLAGSINSSVTTNMDFTFWLLKDNEFINQLQEMAYEYTYYKKVSNGTTTNGYTESKSSEINIPIYVKRTFNGKTYLHKLLLSQFGKTYVNNDFTIGSMKLTLCARR